VTQPPLTITLHDATTTATVHPDEGGRIGQIDVSGQPLLRDTPAPAERDHIGWGMYPMAPWAGRIREGRFSFEGTTSQL
jgi:aldose 1-epimerase